MLAKKALSATAGAPKLYVEDVMSCFLYTGNGSTQTITNGIDLAGEGGLVWIKSRNDTTSHFLYDTTRDGRFSTNTTGGNSSGFVPTYFNFNSNGFFVDAIAGTGVNDASDTYVSWTFRKAEKFFDVVTYTGNGSNRTISHNLGSVPGCIIVKRTSTAKDWAVYHRSVGNTKYLTLNATSDAATVSTYWNNTDPTSTVFTVGTDGDVNANGETYVAYLFAHDAGGFGDAGDQSIIKCGSVVGSSQVEVSLGWEPQWILVKNTSAAQDWWVVDNMRGLPVQDTSSAYNASNLRPHLSDAETTGFSIAPSATGFKANVLTAGQTYIYIAIRRGPMKTPESGAEVFSPQTSSAAEGTVVTTSFPVDAQILGFRTLTQDKWIQDRLRGVSTTATSIANPVLATNKTDFEISNSGGTKAWNNTGFQIPSYSAGYSTVYWNFRRAPGFFDVVCYTGTGSATTFSHNLGVAPELMIIKNRNAVTHWPVYYGNSGTYMHLSLNDAASTSGSFWNSTSPTSSVFTVGTSNQVNGSTNGMVAYLFASLSGVSKVGSYTGNGSSQTINCGFTAGARFVLIKRTDSTGDWVVFDSARGIVSGNDPYLRLNSTAAEVTDKDAVDTDNTGFVVNETTGPNVNTNGASYIFLAVS